MRLLSVADARATDGLPNIGFCYVGVWGESRGGLFAHWDGAVVTEVRALYEMAHRELQATLRRTPAGPGRAWIVFLANRVRCTSIYLNGIGTALPLVALIGARPPEELTPLERAEVRRICSGALAILGRYQRLHARLMPDRGCEGTLISVFYTPMSVLRRIRYEYGGGANDPWPVEYESADAPPAPIALE